MGGGRKSTKHHVQYMNDVCCDTNVCGLLTEKNLPEMSQKECRFIHPVPSLPPLIDNSPEIVRVLDIIRFKLGDKDAEKFDEFYWFAREYPRCYRYHLDCADFRLKTIHELYLRAHTELSKMLSPESYAVSIGNREVHQIYWDFESLLSEISISLDLLARIVGSAFETHMPVSFNKLCKKQNSNPILEKLQSARKRWVLKLKDYRDCFIHYTPVDTMLSISLVQRWDGFHIRGKLPTNPNIRDIAGFRFSKRVELLKYACTVYKHMKALDRAIAKEIFRAYRRNEYPKKLTNLFFIGRRET